MAWYMAPTQRLFFNGMIQGIQRKSTGNRGFMVLVFWSYIIPDEYMQTLVFLRILPSSNLENVGGMTSSDSFPEQKLTESPSLKMMGLFSDRLHTT